jgi:hypothetical protein
MPDDGGGERLADRAGAWLGHGGASGGIAPQTAESCVAINIIVIIMKLWNRRFSVIKSNEIIKPDCPQEFP